MKNIKENIISIIVGLIILTSLYIGIRAKHKYELIEVARVSQFIGCLQGTQATIPPVCLKIVELTHHSKLIKEILDSKEDNGKLIIEESKKLMPTGRINGNDI